MRRVLAALGLIVASLAAVAATRLPIWSEGEIRTLRSIWIGSLAPAPPDPSNRYADLPEAAALGQRLFFDTRLSRPAGISCATCHRPDQYFTDGLARSRGLGETRRGAPTVVGSAHSPWFYWDGRRDSAWSQAVAPLEAEEEMNGRRTDLARRIAAEPDLRRGYEAVFGPLPDLSDRLRYPALASPAGTAEERRRWQAMSDADRATVNRVFANLGKALAAYQRMLVPGPSRFDRYVERVLEGDPGDDTLTADERAGLRLFIGEEARCLRCHNGPLLSNHGFHNVGVQGPAGTREDRGREAAIPEVLEDEFNCLGPASDAHPDACLELRFMKTEGHELRGAFKVPTLRSVSRTAPYMHTGGFSDLRSVLEHYNHPRPALGHLELQPLDLGELQLRQLEAFLRTLDSPVAVDPEWLAPPAR